MKVYYEHSEWFDSWKHTVYKVKLIILEIDRNNIYFIVGISSSKELTK